ncbi:beta-1,6-N-acetylglucosaminyltransferase [Rufibacter glacialis]|uniref:Peptide O-xylosyltransferase n=1 Tax=Rufibacter glacialis TaxID=1259555 RepID=A0A5M8QMS3_9BACT|nr:beta-1,6-N-acetylglucosaminyltransferase [Rufibacter glacialis]KAA6437517.1 beta-1,6-N-acetylglucosaminyltransferase [Rufibacter glacialis]GGK58663.1 hypothetical protein GCM10011405_03440 [Rufibacter glacialis]
MDINYVILAHKNPEQIKRLVERLKSVKTRFFIHVDKNVEIDLFKKALPEDDKIFYLRDREDGTWGDVGIVKATIIALEQIVNKKCTGYCVLLSGQDYPIKSNAEIETFLKRNYGSNFIETYPIPSEKWVVGDSGGQWESGGMGGIERIQFYKFNLSLGWGRYILLPSLLSKEFYKQWRKNLQYIGIYIRHKKTFPFPIIRQRKFPDYLRPFGGSQWWALPIETVNKIVLFLKQHRDYLIYNKYSLLPDEFFFHSIIEYLASVENNVVIKPSVTYVNWKREGVTLPVTFNSDDLNELISQPEEFLFARKFDCEYDKTILDLLDENV